MKHIQIKWERRFVDVFPGVYPLSSPFIDIIL